MEKNMNLKNYFIEEIMRVSKQEVACLDQELCELRKERLQMIENQINQDMSKQQAYLENEMQMEHKKRISKLKEQSKLKLYDYRNELVSTLFQELQAMLMTFKVSDEYIQYLKLKLQAYSEMKYENFVAKIAKDDQKYVSLFQTYSFCNIEIDEQMIGGFILINEKDGMMIDESLDSKLLEAKNNFYHTSNFTV